MGNTEIAAANPDNIVPLDSRETLAENLTKSRFKLIPFTNVAGSKSWRVTGTKRDGARVRENYSDRARAECRQLALEAEYRMRQPSDARLHATSLTDTQVKLAEVVFTRLDSDEEVLRAIDYWIQHGRQNAVAESPRLDDAVKQFKEWLQGCNLRDRTKANLRTRVDVFANSVANLRVADISAEVIDEFLDKRSISASSKDNDRRAISRFFSWCMDRRRRWATANPCRAVKVEQGERPPPAVLTLEQCKRLLNAAETFKGGRLAPYVAVCLFAGLRPFEAARLTWAQVNMKDGEIRLEGSQTKTGTPRVVAVDATLKRWLKAYKDKPFFPPNWRKDFDAMKESAGFGEPTDAEPNRTPWPEDVMRHTAISHYFRRTGSYGQTAEHFGNSEAIVKRHYQARVSSDDTKRFYALKPR